VTGPFGEGCKKGAKGKFWGTQKNLVKGRNNGGGGYPGGKKNGWKKLLGFGGLTEKKVRGHQPDEPKKVQGDAGFRERPSKTKRGKEGTGATGRNVPKRIEGIDTWGENGAKYEKAGQAQTRSEGK